MQAPALSAVLLSSLHFSLEDTGRSRSLHRAEFQYAVRETCQEPPRTRAAVPWSHGYGKPRARRWRWEKRWHWQKLERVARLVATRGPLPKEPAFPRSGDFRRAPGTKQKTEIAASETGARRALPAASPAPSPTLHDARGFARTRAGFAPMHAHHHQAPSAQLQRGRLLHTYAARILGSPPPVNCSSPAS